MQKQRMQPRKVARYIGGRVVSNHQFDSTNSLDTHQAGEGLSLAPSVQAPSSPFKSFTAAITSVLSKISGKPKNFGEPILPNARPSAELPGSMVSVEAIRNHQEPKACGTVIEPFESDGTLFGKATESARLRITLDENDQLVARFSSGDKCRVYRLDPDKPALDLRALPDDMSLIVSADSKGVLEALNGH